MRFSRTRSGALRTEIAPVEVSVLASAAADLIRLITDDQPREGQVDPLEAMVGLSSREARRPDDPALQRLLPDAYRDDAFPADVAPGGDRATAAQEASQEFRRFTEADLRAGKRAHADTVLETLAGVASGGELMLDRAQADAWLGFLNDVRLVLGVRLEVDEDTLEEPPESDDDDPRTQALEVYSWLGWVQESLLSCLDPRTS